MAAESGRPLIQDDGRLPPEGSEGLPQKQKPLHPEPAQLQPYSLAFKPLSDSRRPKQIQELIWGEQPEPIKLQAQPKQLTGGDLLRSIRSTESKTSGMFKISQLVFNLKNVLF